MLNKVAIMQDRTSAPRAQSGIVLIIALIILIAMTIAGIAMIRSVDLTNIIAGNLAFKQAATHSGDTGVETAFAFLEANKAGTFLHTDVSQPGLLGQRQRRGAQPRGRADLGSLLGGLAGRPNQNHGARRLRNTVSYIIDRLCANAGRPDCRRQLLGVNGGFGSQRLRRRSRRKSHHLVVGDLLPNYRPHRGSAQYRQFHPVDGDTVTPSPFAIEQSGSRRLIRSFP